jgi:hypothetical protein
MLQVHRTAHRHVAQAHSTVARLLGLCIQHELHS